jgi:hypothetical protein
MIRHHYTVEIRHLFRVRSGQQREHKTDQKAAVTPPSRAVRSATAVFVRRPSCNADSAVDQGRPTGSKWLAQKGNGLVKMGGKTGRGEWTSAGLGARARHRPGLGRQARPDQSLGSLCTDSRTRGHGLREGEATRERGD